MAFALDKNASKQALARVPEKRLLLLSLAGGWPGGIVAMKAMAHKTRKGMFLAAFTGAAIVNVIAVIYLLRLF